MLLIAAVTAVGEVLPITLEIKVILSNRAKVELAKPNCTAALLVDVA
jgi:hypothetical protein